MSDPKFDQIELRWTVRHRGERRIIDVALVNAQSIPDRDFDTARMYQVCLTATALDGNSSISSATTILTSMKTSRINSTTNAAPWNSCTGNSASTPTAANVPWMPMCATERVARRLTTTCFPAADVPLVVPGDAEKMPGLILDMSRLGSPDLARYDLARALRP